MHTASMDDLSVLGDRLPACRASSKDTAMGPIPDTASAAARAAADPFCARLTGRAPSPSPRLDPEN